MHEIDDHVAGERLRMLQRFAQRVHRSRRHAGQVEIQSAFVRVASTAFIASVSAARFVIRAELVEKRGSSRHSG